VIRGPKTVGLRDVLVTVDADPLPAGPPEDELPPPPLDPLFRPQWSRALISTLARIQRPGGPPEVTRLVELAVERKPVDALPSTMVETADGADILVDTGEGMSLFARDQEQLTALMGRVLGTGHLSIFRFQVSPERGVIGGNRYHPRPYTPPQPGWPVVLLTDLGISAHTVGRAVDWQEWLTFAARIRAADCHLIVLAPYPAARWPAMLRGAMDIVQWDRSTSVRTVRAALRCGWGRCACR
jgi:hypothetical protein